MLEHGLNPNQMCMAFIASFLWCLSTSLSAWIKTDLASGGLWYIYVSTECLNFRKNETKFSWDALCKNKALTHCNYKNESIQLIFDKGEIDSLCEANFPLIHFLMCATALVSGIAFLIGAYILLSSKKMPKCAALYPMVLLVGAVGCSIGAMTYWAKRVTHDDLGSCFSLNIAAWVIAVGVVTSMIFSYCFPGLCDIQLGQVGKKQPAFKWKSTRRINSRHENQQYSRPVDNDSSDSEGEPYYSF